MNKEELKKKFDEERIRPEIYWFSGGLPGDTFCLSEENNKWQVYYSDRGKKLGLKEFETEDEACRYLYEFVIKTKGTRLP